MRLRRTLCGAFAAILVATLALVGALALVPGSARAASQGRVEMSFNNDWRFWEGNVSGADAADYDDSEWLYVNVPHSTIKYTPENCYHEDLGVFWYRRHFETPETVQDGRRALITFGAAMQKAEVWLNGEKLGTHEGGYTEFSYDITDKLAPAGEENVLAVKLDTNPNAAFAPGKNNPDFQYFGGLYRNVTLTVTDPVHVTDAVSSGTVGGGGVFLAATSLADDHSSATVNAKTEVENSGAAEAQVTVKTEILNEDGSVATETQSEQAVSAGEKVTFSQDVTVSNPRLWSTDTPELYTVRTTVFQNGEACDSAETTFGIRTVEWVRDSEGTACLINGERVHLNGTNLHSETYMLGNAASDDAVDAEIKRLREYGFNFVRMAHYPHSQAFYDACDKYGVADLEAKRQDNGSAQWVEISEFTASGEELSALLDLEYNKVATASSCADGVTPGDGNEDNPAKHWVPAADDAEAWWMVDTADIYDRSEVQFTWAGEAEAHRYKVEVSYDGVTWAPVADHMTDGVSGLASADKVGQTARYLRVSVAQGTSEGFYVRLKGRAVETPRALVQVLDVEPVVTEAGTPFSELGLPAEVMVQLEGDVATSLPVIWDEGSYDAETAGSQTVSGTLSLIPGVSADESALVASVVVTLEELPAPVLDRIVVTAPTKTTYVQGEELELAGMKVEAVYSDGSRVNVTDEATVSGFDPSKLGAQSVTVSFGELTATFQVTVVEPEPEPEPGEDTKSGDDQKPGSDDVKPGDGQQGTSDPDDQQGDKRPSDDVKPSDEVPAGSASDDAALPSAGEAADPTASLLTLGLLATASAVVVRGARRER